MPLVREVSLGQDDIVLDRNPPPLPKKGHINPHFSAHVCCGQTARWIKMPLGMEIGLGPSHIVLDENAAPKRRCRAPNFRPMSVVAKRLDG